MTIPVWMPERARSVLIVSFESLSVFMGIS
jgi:hypothetical protein